MCWMLRRSSWGLTQGAVQSQLLRKWVHAGACRGMRVRAGGTDALGGGGPFDLSSDAALKP